MVKFPRGTRGASASGSTPSSAARRVGDELAGALGAHRRVAEQGSHSGSVEQRHREVGCGGGAGAGAQVKFAGLDSRRDQVLHPLAVLVVEAGGDWPERGLADGAQPELHPEDPLLLLDAGEGQALGEAEGERLGRRSARGRLAEALVAGLLEGVDERLLEQLLAR